MEVVWHPADLVVGVCLEEEVLAVEGRLEQVVVYCCSELEVGLKVQQDPHRKNQGKDRRYVEGVLLEEQLVQVHNSFVVG